MRLGIVVTDAAEARTATALVSGAAERGWECRCFLTDTGVRLLDDAAFITLADAGKAKVAVCELSVDRYLDHDAVGRFENRVVIGGQYQDAELVHWCDRVVVF